MEVIYRPNVLADLTRLWRGQEKAIGFVPTMGALHAGHLSLVEQARKRCDAVVVSIFVNPMQFGPQEDYARYPRRQEQDLALLRAAGVDAAYLPEIRDIYPRGFATRIVVEGVTEGLCGAVRPGHFEGVATVVAKLLMQVLPDIAIFGEKDYQQLQVIKRMARDLDMPVAILGAPILREADGLAMSSRNAYLTPSERRTAPALYGYLRRAAEMIEEGEAVRNTLDWARQQLRQSGFDEVEYLECRDEASLDEVWFVEFPARLLAAVRLGKTRLIDNVRALPPGEAA